MKGIGLLGNWFVKEIETAKISMTPADKFKQGHSSFRNSCCAIDAVLMGTFMHH